MADNRHEGPKNAIASFAFDAITIPATQTTAETGTLGTINGILRGVDIVTTDTEDGITYTVAITNGNGATLYSEAALADNSALRKSAATDFDPQAIAGETLTLTVTPSAAPDAGEVGSKTATVTVTIQVE